MRIIFWRKYKATTKLIRELLKPTLKLLGMYFESFVLNFQP